MNAAVQENRKPSSPPSSSFSSSSSIHQRFVAGYVRHGCGELIQCFGPGKNLVSEKWLEIRQHLLHSPSYNAYSEPLSQTMIQVELRPGTDKSLLFEAPVLSTAHQLLGIILVPDVAAVAVPPSPCAEEARAVDRFFASLILDNLHVGTAIDSVLLRQTDVDAVTDAIVDLFDSRLRYAPPYDRWHQGGRAVFRDAVGHFTARGQMVEFCLPAFPCKSSSAGKVLSKMPDRGEYLALENMHSFVRDVEAVYEPGAKLWIISDGHVFSDCIGVDDHIVDSYGAHLHAMNRDIVKRRGGSRNIAFRSLPELFASHCDGDELPSGRDLTAMLPELVRPIETQATREADMCRRILVMGFQLDDAELRDQLSSQDSSIIALYRGFSKFMLEDLTTNKYTSHLSRSQLRKKSAKVAFEMIQRNQAYSNLVQMLFPYHVRLSIHAHDNAGPKFGIQMLGKDIVPTDVLPPDGTGTNCSDKLHVPTPWHNCIVEIRGDPHLYITKSSVVRSALASGAYACSLRESPGQGQGEYVYLSDSRRSRSRSLKSGVQCEKGRDGVR